LLFTTLHCSNTDLQGSDAEIQANVTPSLEQHCPELLTAHILSVKTQSPTDVPLTQ